MRTAPLLEEKDTGMPGTKADWETKSQPLTDRRAVEDKDLDRDNETRRGSNDGDTDGEGEDIFTKICKGRLSLTRKNWKDFLESICAHPEPSLCLELLTSTDLINRDTPNANTNTEATNHPETPKNLTSTDLTDGDTTNTNTQATNRPETPKPAGLLAFNRAMNMDYSYFFYEYLLTRLITFFRNPAIQPSRVRDTLVGALTDPPIFWVSLISAIWRMNLPEETVESIAWLVWQYYSYLSETQSPDLAVKLDKGSYVVDLLLQSSRKETREIAKKLQVLLPPESKAMGYEDGEFDVDDFDKPPGGRHDNDHEYFRKISIYPTPLEINSKKLPYLPTMATFGGGEKWKEVEEGGDGDGGARKEGGKGAGGVSATEQEQQYLEALFRLYREDTVETLRYLIRAPSGAEDPYLGSTTPQLELADVVVDSAKGDRRRWALAFRTCEELVWFSSQPPSPISPNPITGVDGGAPGNATPLNQPGTRYRSSIAETIWWADGSPAFMLDGDEVIGVCTYVRDIKRLAQSPSVIVVHLQGTENIIRFVMSRIKTSQAKAEGKQMKDRGGREGGGGIRLLFSNVVRSDSFKVLEKVQMMQKVPFREEILSSSSSSVKEPENVPRELLKGLEANPTIDIGQFFGLHCYTTLDAEQSEALSSALRERVCLIQGLPSTGKSLLASLITKALYEHTSQSIMIITNDANSLSKLFYKLTTRVCIPTTEMVFLTETPAIPLTVTLKGLISASQTSESFPSVLPASLASQPSQAVDTDPTLLGMVKASVELGKEIKAAFDGYHIKPSPATSPSPWSSSTSKAIMRYLATQESEVEYYNAFRVPEEDLDSKESEEQSSKLDETYLFDRWQNGEDAGVFLTGKLSPSSAAWIWETSVAERREKVDRWGKALTPAPGSTAPSSSDTNVDTDRDDDDDDAISRLYNAGQQFDVYQEVLRLREMDPEFAVLKEKRIIGGTKHNLSEIRELLSDADMPEVVIIVGADALLECEVITMLGSKMKHLVMVGNIPMRRSTVTLTRLTAASKKGHNLDVSLFERLVQKGHPCHTLHTIYPSDTQAGIPPSNTGWGWGGQTYPRLQTIPAPPPALAPLPLPPPPRRISSWSSASYVSSRAGSPSPPLQTSTITPPNAEAPPTTVLQRKIGTSEKEWNRRKTDLGVSNDHVDAIMEMVGMEEVKEKVLDIMDTVELMKKQKRPMKVTFNAALFGNPGTGMLTFAKLYFKFLKSIGAILGTQFLDINVIEAENFKTYVRRIKRRGGGIHVVGAHKPGRYAWSTWLTGSMVDSVTPDTLVEQMTKGAGKQAYLFSGTKEKMETWLASNPVLNDALPYGFYFPDYEEEELLQVFELRLVQLFQGQMKVEGGIEGPYVQLAIRKLAGRRNCEGFGNEAEVDNLIDDTLIRQARRLVKLRAKEGVEGGGGEESEPDCMLITKEDLLAQSSKPIRESEAYKEIHSLIGLTSVKATVDSLVRLVQVNNERQLKGKKPVEILLNRVFLGPPGTGKTTVAKLYAKILNEMGLLSTGEVVVKNANDFIGQFIGQSEANTKAILASAIGKVLIIDEAHTLNPTSRNNADVFKEDVIDSLVSGIQNISGDDQCVLLLGYEEEMFEMFENANPGLNRRFRISDSFYFPDFTTDELMQIFDAKLKKEELSATPAARKVVSDMLDRARHRPNFGNGGAVDNMIANAKENYYGRFEVMNFPDDIVFEPQDFDLDYDRGGEGSERLTALFEEMVGCEDVMAKFEEYQIVSRTMRKCGKDAKKVIPMNFVFKGPPGTGKTTIARKMGQIFYDMGFLASPEVIECSATDMIGSYLGQTGPKTRQLFKKALGKVLFVDEAYRLCHGEYAQEAIGELVTLLTQKTYHMKMVVVLAGYDKDMDLLLLRNRGLASRFPEEIVFDDIEPQACLEILRRLLEKSRVRMRCLEDKGRDYRKMADIIKRMSGSPAWGNARDMVSLSVHLVREAHKVQNSPEVEDEVFELSSKAALKHLVAMREEQQKRASSHPQNKLSGHGEGEKFNPSAVLEQLNVARWRAVKQQLSGVNSSYSRTQFYDIPGP